MVGLDIPDRHWKAELLLKFFKRPFLWHMQRGRLVCVPTSQYFCFFVHEIMEGNTCWARRCFQLHRFPDLSWKGISRVGHLLYISHLFGSFNFSYLTEHSLSCSEGSGEFRGSERAGGGGKSPCSGSPAQPKVYHWCWYLGIDIGECWEPGLGWYR